MAKWVNYGDVNPLEHGGLWISHDTGKVYRAIVADVIPHKDGNNEYLFSDLKVDLENTWYEWTNIESFADVSKETSSDYALVTALLGYYMYAEFGTSKTMSNKETVIEELKKYDIEL